MKTMEKKTIKLLARVTALLTDIAGAGLSATGKDMEREIANVLEGLRFYRLHRLHRSLSQLRNLLGPRQPGRALVAATLLGDALYTSKAIKTYLKGRLDDPRIAEDVLGKEWEENELETVEAMRLVVVGENERNTFYVDLLGGGLYRTPFSDGDAIREGRRPSPRPTGEMRVELCKVFPNFPPAHIAIGRYQQTGPTSAEALNLIRELAKTDYAAEVEALRQQVTNLFAPRDRYCLLAVHRVVTGKGRIFLCDAAGNLLRVSEREEGQWTRAACLRWLCRHRAPEVVFGRLYFKREDAGIAPLGVIGDGYPDLGIVLLNRLTPLLGTRIPAE